MRHFLDTVAEPGLWFLADWSLRWAALIGVTVLAMRLWRPRRAALRQLMCGVALLGGLFSPVLPRWGSGWRLAPKETAAAPQAEQNTSFPSSAWERTSGSSASRPIRDKARSGASRPAFPSGAWEREGGGRVAASPPSEALGNRRLAVLGLALCWGLGVLILLIRWLGGEWFLWRLRREAVDVQGSAMEMFAACRGELDVRGRVRLAAHPRVRSPVLLGLFRLLILVPPDWPQLPVDVQRAALLHELAHVRRRDHWLVPLLEMIRVAFFFHPLVRWLLARLEYERELLCDEMVVRRGVDRHDYARLLLNFARASGRLTLLRWSGGSYLPMGRRRTVKARIHHLLEENMERWMGPLSARWTVVLGASLLALMLGLASYRVRAVEVEKASAPAEKEKPALAPKAEDNGAGAAKSSATRLKREELRYGGKDFNEWRTGLLTELKGSIRVDGMKAFAAFGANGYGSEATQAILEMMRGYDTTNEEQKDDDGAVVVAGYRAIQKIGAAAVPALTKAVKEENRNVRRFAIQSLGNLETDARSALPALLQAVKSNDAVTHRFAMEAAYRVDPHSKEVLAVLIETVKNEEGGYRYRAILLIRGIGKKAHSAIPALLKALGDKDWDTRQLAVRTLTDVGAGKEAVPTVSRLLRDEDQNVRSSAYQFLQALGPDAEEAVPALVAVVKETDGGFRSRAFVTLRKIGPAAKAAVPVLDELLKSENNEVRSEARETLKVIRPGRE